MYYKFKENKFIDFLIIVIATVIAVLFISNVIIDSIGSWQGIVAIASALGTVWAAVATWLAARKAAESAQIARQSMEYSMELGKKTLEETQTSNRHAAFENRYAMLLAQHDNYHNQLCSYLDTGKLSKSEYDNIKAINSYSHSDKQRSQVDIYEFFHISIHELGLENCLAFLTGHEIISRYMRTLYHLLKFVHTECVYNGAVDYNFQKNYTSPVRSTIRNDVLLLIAVNALNVRSQRAKNSSYPYYQQLLHTFNFFEHAIFMFPEKPNELFGNDDWTGSVRKQILSRQSDFMNKRDEQRSTETRSFTIPPVRLMSPLMLIILIFKNPMLEAAQEALASLAESYDMSEKVQEEIREALEELRTARNVTNKASEFEGKFSKGVMWEPVEEAILSEIEMRAFMGFCKYDHTSFRYHLDGEVHTLKGESIRMLFRNLMRYDGISKRVEEHNGLEEYMHHLKEEYAASLMAFMKEVNAYKSEPVISHLQNAAVQAIPQL